MADLKYKTLTGIEMEKLPLLPSLDVNTLRKSIEKGVRHAIPPWMLSAELPTDISDNQLQGIYDVAMTEYTDAIMLVIINEYLIS